MCVSSYFAHYRWLQIYLITLIASRHVYDVSDMHSNEHNIYLVMRLHLRNYFELKCLRESNEAFVGPPCNKLCFDLSLQNSMFPKEKLSNRIFAFADILYCKTQRTTTIVLSPRGRSRSNQRESRSLFIPVEICLKIDCYHKGYVTMLNSLSVTLCPKLQYCWMSRLRPSAPRCVSVTFIPSLANVYTISVAMHYPFAHYYQQQNKVGDKKLTNIHLVTFCGLCLLLTLMFSLESQWC